VEVGCQEGDCDCDLSERVSVLILLDYGRDNYRTPLSRQGNLRVLLLTNSTHLASCSEGSTASNGSCNKRCPVASTYVTKSKPFLDSCNSIFMNPGSGARVPVNASLHPLLRTNKDKFSCLSLFTINAFMALSLHPRWSRVTGIHYSCFQE
jgi:hypothetical protein